MDHVGAIVPVTVLENSHIDSHMENISRGGVEEHKVTRTTLRPGDLLCVVVLILSSARKVVTTTAVFVRILRQSRTVKPARSGSSVKVRVTNH
jgi:hypothetical protein